MEGQLLLPDLNIVADISFLLDTGSDRSVLMPADGLRIGVPYHSLNGNFRALGVGGPTDLYEERAILIFEDNTALYAYELPQFLIAHNKPQLLKCVSIPGRDVMNRWNITYDPAGVGL